MEQDDWKAGLVGELLGAGPGVRRQDQGPPVAFEPANLLSVYALIMAAKLKGGGVDNIEPAWELLRAQKPWVGVIVMASDAAAPYFENDQVWLARYWSARSGYYVAPQLSDRFHHPEGGHDRAGQRAGVPVGAANKKLAFEFLNFRLDPEVQRAFHLAYQRSPGRPDITDWPADYAATQIITEQKMAGVDFPDSAVIGSRRREWTRKWQEIMS